MLSRLLVWRLLRVLGDLLSWQTSVRLVMKDKICSALSRLVIRAVGDRGVVPVLRQNPRIVL